jgi:hypothetical protein
MLMLGCSDPIIGDWEQQNSLCDGSGEFTVDDDLGAEGTLYLPDGTGSCLACTFDGDVTNEDHNEYSADITFHDCSCQGNDSADADCLMSDDDAYLDCTLHLPGCGDLGSSWQKVE